MASKPSSSRTKSTRPRRVSQRTIGATVRRIAEKFKPEKIILFGSYAYGKPTPNSDVDLLVVMDTPLKEREQAFQIKWTVLTRENYFPLDLIVRTPRNLQNRIKKGDFFLREITSQGKVLYESLHT